MGKKIISFGLSAKEIGRAIKELEQYKKEIEVKTQRLCQIIAEEITANAQSGFSGAIADDLLNGAKPADVTVDYQMQGDDVIVVIANGPDAVWVEFGAGVYHNGSAGSSPHPKGTELDMIIGGYGYGMGKRKVWGFKDDSGELRLTHGTPAVMPMYNALKIVTDRLTELVREVYG